VRSLVPWALVFLCALVFTFLVPDLGGNFFGIPESALPFLFAANLTLFLWLLARFVGKPIASFLEARRQGIAEELEQARAKLVEAESLRDEVHRRLAEVEREVEEMKVRAERDGAAEAEQIAVQTAADQERFLRRVDEEIRRRTAEARDNLAHETAELTAKLTKQVLEKEITGEDRRRILDESLSAMPSATGKE
jgi:F-type H+-transporting ATPase subunit b